MTKEEIIISLGLDNTAASKGMQAFNFIAQESIEDTLKGIKRLVGINMVEVVQDAIRYWGVFTEWLGNNLFNVDAFAAVGRELEKWRLKITAIAKEAAKLREEIAKLDASGIDTATKMKDVEDQLPEAKFKMLREQETAAAFRRAGFMQQAATHTLEALKFEKQWKQLLAEKEELQEKLNDEAEKENEQRKQNLNVLVQSVKKIEDARRSAATAEAALAKAQHSGREFTLSELASSKWLQGTPWQQKAAEILRLRQWAKENAMAGFTSRSDLQTQRADKLFNDLKKANPFLVDPMDELIQKADEQNAKLQEMLTSGIAIKQAANLPKK